jgi:hypothetical protein
MERLRSSTHGHGGIFNLHPSVEPTLSEQIYSIDMILIECARGSDVEAVKPRAPDESREIPGVMGKGEAEVESPIWPRICCLTCNFGLQTHLG